MKLKTCAFFVILAVSAFAREAQPGDDHGGKGKPVQIAREAEPGDNRGAREPEPGDNRGREAQPGDDHGGKGKPHVAA